MKGTIALFVLIFVIGFFAKKQLQKMKNKNNQPEQTEKSEPSDFIDWESVRP